MAKPLAWTLGALYLCALLTAILSTRGVWRDLVCGANSLGFLGWTYWQTRGRAMPLGIRWLMFASVLLLVAGMIETTGVAVRGGAP